MDGSTTTKTNGLQEYFVLCYSNARTEHACIQWAIQHKDDHWSQTRFTDEFCSQLFRNTSRRWSRNASTEVNQIPKNKQKIMGCGCISIKNPIGYHSFKTIIDGSYDVQSLQANLIRKARRQFGRRWRLQRENYSTHKSQLAQQFLSSELPEVID